MSDNLLPFTAAEMNAYLREVFPQADVGETFVVEDVSEQGARLRLRCDDKHLRPGGTISGPTMFALADIALYVAILGRIGPVALAVTTNLNINFLRKPPAGDLIGEARLLKLGKRLAVGEVSIMSALGDELVAHAVGTYSIPTKER
jgi:uncharacterized protein (TIGR00369 family)